MSAHLLITSVTWAVFVALFVITATEALRRPNQAHFDIALLFAAPVAVVIMALAARAGLLSRGPPYNALLSTFQLALPYLTLRLARDFATVPTWASQLALLGFATLVAAGWAIPPDERQWLFPLQLTFFIVVQLASAAAFADEARRALGITRRRLTYGAAGALVLGLAPLAAVLRVQGELWLTIYELGNLVAGLCYFVAFAPPGQLRRSWLEPELRQFLRASAAMPHLAEDGAVLRALEQSAARALGAPIARIGLWDESRATLRFAPDDEGPALPAGGAEAARQAFHSQRPLRNSVTGPEQRALLAGTTPRGATLAAPLSVGQRRLGVLTVYTPREAIFARDDLEVVDLLATQAASVLENRALIAELAHVQARAESARLKDDFLSAAAHNLKTPLTTLVAQAHLLERRAQRHPDEPPSPRSLALLVQAAERLRELVHTLLDAARAEHGQLVGHRTEMDLAALAHEVARPYSSARHACTVRAEHPVYCLGDQERLAQLLDYLLDNAVKFSPNGGPVEVQVHALDGEARLSVSDHGIGITAADVPHVFERFYRGTNVDDRRFAGMGLSLAICRVIVEQHRGRIWVESQLGAGSSFNVALPLAKQGVANDGPERANPHR